MAAAAGTYLMQPLMCACFVCVGDVVKFAAIREGPRLTFDLLDTTRCNNLTCSPTAPSSPYTMHRTAPQHQQQQRQQQEDSEGQQHSSAAGQQSDAVAVHPAPRPPWLRVGAGIEDPAVWSVNKCEQLLGQMLMRAPGAKFPPIWKDLALMQVRTGHRHSCCQSVLVRHATVLLGLFFALRPGVQVEVITRC